MNYKKLSQFVVQRDLCKRYSENERAVLTDEEISWLTLTIQERTLAITNQTFPLYKDINSETLLLGNTLFENISNQLTMNSLALGLSQLDNPKIEEQVQSIEVNDRHEAKNKPQIKTGPIKIIRNRIKDLGLQSFQTIANPKKDDEPAISLSSTNSEHLYLSPLADSNSEHQTETDSHETINQLQNNQYPLNKVYIPLKKRNFNLEPNQITKKQLPINTLPPKEVYIPLKKRKLDLKPNTNIKKEEEYFNPLPTKNNDINMAYGYSDEETPDFISEVEEIPANNPGTETFIYQGLNLETFDKESLTPESAYEKKTQDSDSLLVEHPTFTNEVPRQAIICDESLVVNLEQHSDNTVKKQDIDSFYNRAKKKLRIIHNNFQQESRQLDQFLYDTNYYSFESEKKAINSIQKILAPHGRASTYYFKKSSMENSLEGVRTELEFINVYLIDETLFNDEITLLEKCREACTTILLSKTSRSENFKTEAKDLKDSIINYYLPITHFNFAVYNFKKINNEVLVALKNESLPGLDQLITDLEKSVTVLKNAFRLLKTSKHKVDVELNTIINFLAKSYEDLADFKSRKVDLMLEKNQNADSLLNLLKEIKSNYYESHSYVNDQLVWLSILYAQHRLIETYADNINFVKEGLNETINLIDELIKKGLSASEESSTHLEILYYLLYACSKADSLTNPASDEFKQKALGFMKLHLDPINRIDSDCDPENLSADIIEFLVQLKLIDKGLEWNLQSAIKQACIFSQNDNQTSNINSIVYVKETTILTINYKDSANLPTNKQEFQGSGSRSGFFQRAKSQQSSQSDLNSDKGFRI
ncbi:MAG: hypothetical protein H0T84_14330 [Tatlockia sp.]|nr:hypothetical protein [Tatlockia sp.]